MLNWRKNIFTKKMFRYALYVPRFILNIHGRNGTFEDSSPILANSIPKSGTHLLIAILRAFPEIRDWGNFLASTPSFTFRELSVKDVRKRIDRFVPNELVGAHLFYDDHIAAYLSEKHIIHYFIYRDPRDIVVSEAYYLSQMNRWHFMHKYFKSLLDQESRITLAIEGLENLPGNRSYPSILHRVSYFTTWLKKHEIYAIKYEDLISTNKIETIQQIVDHYLNVRSLTVNRNELTKKIIHSINPYNSHTFRTGKSGNWKAVFTERQKDLFKEIAGDLLIELGYEKDYNW